MFKKPILIAITLLISTAFIFLLVLPRKDALNAVDKTIQEKKQELKIKESYFADLKRISESLKDYQNQVAKIKLALPEDPQVLVFYDFLQKATSRTGLVLKNVSHNIGSGEISLNLSFSGSMDGFINFLSVLENSARMISIESFSFSGPEKEKDIVDFNLTIKANFIK